MIECICEICGKTIGKFYPSQKRRTCSKTCYNKLVSRMVQGESNPNYKYGKTIKNKCIDCGKLIDARSTRCYSCRGKTMIGKTGHPHTEESKALIGQKSREKFTEEYINRVYRKRFAGRKKKVNGYILIKNYEHPNRNSQNDILAHVLVMSQHIGRPLKNGEVVHHIDGNRENNTLSNLHLFKNRRAHRQSHNSFTALLSDLIKKGILSFNPDTEKYLINEEVVNEDGSSLVHQ